MVFRAGEAHKFWNAGPEVFRCAGYIEPADDVEYFLAALFESQKRGGGSPRRGVPGQALQRRVRARTRALGAWSMLPLLLLFVGTSLRMVLIRAGFPVQNLPQAAREGAITLLIVHSPTLVTDTGWVLIGSIMLRRSGEAGGDAGATEAMPQSGGAEQ